MFSMCMVKINASERYRWAGAQMDKEQEKRCKRKHLTYSISLNQQQQRNQHQQRRIKRIRKQQNGTQSVWRHTEKFHSWISLDFLAAVVTATTAAAVTATDWGIKRKRANDQKRVDNMYVLCMSVVCIMYIHIYIWR